MPITQATGGRAFAILIARLALLSVLSLALGTAAPRLALAQRRDFGSPLEPEREKEAEAGLPIGESLAPVVTPAEAKRKAAKKGDQREDNEREGPKVYTFEFPTAEMKAKMLAESQAKMKRLTAIRPVTVDEYEASWKTDLEVTDQPAGEVLKGLFAKLGVPLAADPETTKLLDKRVTLLCDDCSLLEAIERVCERAGVYADYSGLGQGDGGGLGQLMAFMFCPPSEKSAEADQKTSKGEETEAQEATPTENVVRLRSGKRPTPLKFVGPATIEISQLIENAPYAAGSLSVRVYLAGLPADLARRHELEDLLQVEFAPILDQDKNVLAKNLSTHRRWLELPTIQFQEHYWQLTNLLRRSTEIHVSGVVKISIPTRVTTLVIKGVDSGASTEADGWRMELLKVRTADPGLQFGDESSPRNHNVTFKLTGKNAGVLDLRKSFFFLDAEGNQLESLVSSISADQLTTRTGELATYRGDMVLRGKPVIIIGKLFSESHDVSYPLELTAPLRSFAEQPTELQKLQFEGSSPVSVAVTELLPKEFIPKAKLAVTNQSNKDIDQVSFNYTYLDEQGQEIGRFIGSVSGQATFDGKPSVCVAAGKTASEETSPGFMPKETAQVRIELTSVTFMDGSSWHAPEKGLLRRRLEGPPGPTIRSPRDYLIPPPVAPK